MKLKKHPEKDLNMRKGLYFVIGLLLVLLMIYIALEWKTAIDTNGFDLG